MPQRTSPQQTCAGSLAWRCLMSVCGLAGVAPSQELPAQAAVTPVQWVQCTTCEKCVRPCVPVSEKRSLTLPRAGSCRMISQWHVADRAVCVGRWRKVSQKVYDRTVGQGEDDPWHCRQNFDRPNASCEDPDDDSGSPDVPMEEL